AAVRRHLRGVARTCMVLVGHEAVRSLAGDELLRPTGVVVLDVAVFPAFGYISVKAVPGRAGGVLAVDRHRETAGARPRRWHSAGALERLEDVAAFGIVQ